MTRTDRQPDSGLAHEHKVDPQPSQNGTELATAWTEVRHSQGREQDDAEIREPIADPSSGMDESAGPAIPPWLLTAVAAEKKGSKE